MAENMLSAIHPKSMFLSVAGIHDGALYNQNLLLVEAEKKMMEQAQEVILLADSSKFGQQALVRLCGLNEVDVVVSDAEISNEHRRQIEDAGCQLIIAA
jgi:DeoR family ulaG and ulaABCDEF operon transcriptional repressor